MSKENQHLKNIGLANLTVEQSPHQISVEDELYKAETAKLEKADKKKRKPSDHDKWFYIRSRI